MNFIKIEDAYKNIYLQFPVALLYNEKYKDLSDSAKIAYIIFTDRFRYSIKNNWVDNDGYIYFIYTNDELKDLLNCSKDKVIKIKKELENKKLLHQVKVGLNKPNRLYLGSLEVNATEVYLPENTPSTLDNKGSRKNRLPEKDLSTLDTKGSRKNRLPEKDLSTLDNKGSRKNRLNLYINNLDTLQDTLLDTEQTTNLNLDAISQQIDLENEFARIPKQAKQTLLAFGQNDEDLVYKQFGMIFRAKKEISEKYKCSLLLENFEDEFNFQTKVIANEIFKAKKGSRTIDNVDNFFYGSFKNFFEQQAERIQFKQEIKDEVLPDVPMVNWLE